MYYFSFVELIEKGIKWMKERGGYVLWLWITASSLAGAIFFIVWIEVGFNEARPILVVALLVYFGGVYPIWLYEQHRIKKQNMKCGQR